jgi:hypothetical protein
VQELAVLVEDLAAEEELQIPRHVGDQEADHDHAGHSHHDLLADRRLPEQGESRGRAGR